MYNMDNPECTLLSVVKVEDELKEMKQEPDSDAELEFVQVEDSSSETPSENGIVDAEDSTDNLMNLSEDEIALYDRPMIKVDIGQRRRLRFSEADDMILLRRVAALNPYKCNVLWKEVTHIVAAKAGKNFTLRSIRDHTDLLMNTLSLRGMDACLKRTPPDLWEKKKRLLQLVQSMWKREPLATRSSTSDRVSNRLRRSAALDELPEAQKQTAGAETLKPNFTASRSTSALTAMSSVSKTLSLPLLMQHQNIPVGLNFGAPLQSLACPPLLANTLPPQLAINAQLGLQKLGVPTGFMLPALGRPKQRMLLPSPPTGMCPDLDADGISSDLPLPLVSKGTSASSSVVTPLLAMVHNGTTPTPPASTESVSVTLRNDRNNSPGPSIASVDSDAPLTSVESQRSEQSIGSALANRRQKISSVVRARLNFLQKRHTDQFVLKRRELELEKRKIVLEEKKLSLEERKLKLEEDKWLFDRKEREERLLMMVEERENKMSVERRQQNMIDILLELKKKE